MGKKLPKVPYLYHATYPSRVDSIQEHGITNQFNDRGLIYMCNNLEAIQEFTHNGLNRWSHEFTNEIDEVIHPDGEVFKVPKVVFHDKVAVFKIDASKLKWQNMFAGDSHNTNFYQSQVYMYAGHINPEWIEELIFIPFEKVKEA